MIGALRLNQAKLAAIFLAVVVLSGCGAGPLYVQTAGTAGPLQWQAVDLASGIETRDGKKVDTYEFTLILRETRGIGLNFTNVSSSIIGGGWRAFGRQSKNLQLPAYCELRIPLSATGFKSPLWFVTLTGKDENDKAVNITITVALPPDPARQSTNESPPFSELPPEATINSDLTQSGVSLALLSLEVRRQLRVESIGLNPTDVAALLTTDTGPLAVPISSAKISFEPRIPLTARRGLRNIAGWLISGLLPNNATMTLPLDNQYRQNLSAAVRFTRLMREKQPNTCSQEVVIENVDRFVDFSSLIESSVFDRHGFTLDGWSEDEGKALARILSRIPDAWLTSIRGLTFKRGPGDPTDPVIAGHYNSVAHVITMYDLAFQPLKLGFVGADKTAGAIAHELGHGIDFAPLRRAYDRVQLAFADLDRTAPDREKALQEHIEKLIKDMYLVRSLSGSRWQFNREAKLLEIVDDTEQQGLFLDAAVLDGPVRITEYAGKSRSEHFAECFSLYVVDPKILELLRPNIYSYFAKQFPR